MLARVTPKSFQSLSDSVVKTLGVPALPSVNPNPEGSNVYGVSERVILAWLNHHFEHLRTNLWLEAPQVVVVSVVVAVVVAVVVVIVVVVIVVVVIRVVVVVG